MTAYMSFEWLKLTKRWMPRVILAAVLGVVVIMFLGTGSKPDSNLANLFFPRALPASLIAAAFAAPFFWPVLGGSWPGNEYGWGSVRLILSRRPQRIEHVFASLAVLLVGIALALLAVLVVGSLAGITVSLLTGHAVFVSGVLTGTFVLTILKTFLVTWYGASFILILAFAAGTIFRSAPAGIGVGVGSTLAQFLTIGLLEGQSGIWKTIADHLPLQYVENLTGNMAASAFIPGTSLARVTPGAPGVGQSIIALGIMMVVLLAVTCVAVRNRDITA
jgi:ABC-2 type transport system permease protein